MIKLKTKTEFFVPSKRGFISAIVRFIIDKLEIDNNNIVPKGYYYYKDENNNVVKLDDISPNTILLWDVVNQTENELLGPLTSTTNLKDNLLQRLNDFTFLQLALENGENYGTEYTDFETDND